MLRIMQVISIVYNTLNIAFVVANAHGEGEYEIHNKRIYNERVMLEKAGEFCAKVGDFF